MKSLVIAGLLSLATPILSHATFQDLWVNGVDKVGTCVRAPSSNSPVTDVTSNNIRCNVGGATGVPGVCSVAGTSNVATLLAMPELIHVL